MPRPKAVKVELSEEDRAWLEQVTRSGVRPARMIMRARVLLALDETEGRAPDRAVVAERLGVSETTVFNVAKRFVEVEGDVEVAVSRKKRDGPPVPSMVDGQVEARLIALACSEPPEGRARWSLRLLADKTVVLDDIPDMSYGTVRRVLKKTNFVLI